MEGQAWKEWRSVFNPGFSASHLTTLVPTILEAVTTYSETLAKHSQSKEMFYLEHATIGMTLSIIGTVTLYTSPKCTLVAISNKG